MQIWAQETPPPWHQLTRFLRDDDDVRSLLTDRLLARHGDRLRLTGRPHLTKRSDATWFTGTWDGEDILVKLNVTERERYWMSAVSSRAPDAVAQVHASGVDLDDLDVRWLVLERLPVHAPDPPTSQWFDAALDAAVAFQTAARSIPPLHVHDEGRSFWDHFVAGQIGSAPGPVRELVATLPDDLAWIDATVERHVLFGDLHLGNLAARRHGDQLDVRLFDPIPRRQPWVFEPVYLEQGTGGSGLVQTMASKRRAAGLATADDALVRRAEVLLQAWVGVMWWGIIPPLRADPEARQRLAGWVEAAVALDR